MTTYFWMKGLAVLGLASLLVLGLSPGAAANQSGDREGAVPVPANPYGRSLVEPPSPRTPAAARVLDEARTRARRGDRTALDDVQDDASADPISSVPDQRTLAADAAAERRHARARERARRRAEERDAAARARIARLQPEPTATPSLPAPASHAPPALQSSGAYDAAFAEPVTPRHREPLPEARAEDREPALRLDANLTHDPRAMTQLADIAASAAPPISAVYAIRVLDAALSQDPDDTSGDTTAAEPAPEPAGVPTRDDVQAAVATIADAIRACAQDRSGHTVEVRATFLRSGRTAHALVSSPTIDIEPAQLSCMARVARTARTPEFEDERFEVTYRLRL